MKRPLQPEDVGELLRTHLSGARPPASVEARIVRGARDRLEGRRGRPWLAAVVGATAVVAAAVAVWRLPRSDSGEGSVPRGFVHAYADPTRSYRLGRHQVEVTANSWVRFDETQPQAVSLFLSAGQVVAQVEPLAAGSFRVRTKQATVEVVGTLFTVEGFGDCTRVAVTRGRVRVTYKEELQEVGADEERLLCDTLPPAASTDAEDIGQQLVRQALLRISAGAPKRKTAALLESYLERYPGGVFEEDVLFHLSYLKAELGQRAEAERLAKLFMERFPDNRRGAVLRRRIMRAR